MLQQCRTNVASLSPAKSGEYPAKPGEGGYSLSPAKSGEYPAKPGEGGYSLSPAKSGSTRRSRGRGSCRPEGRESVSTRSRPLSVKECGAAGLNPSRTDAGPGAG